jgi:hypothetical protein
MRGRLLVVMACACSGLVLSGAGRQAVGIGDRGATGPVTTTASGSRQSDGLLPGPAVPVAGPTVVSAAPLYYLNWYSVNGGGATSVVGTNFRLGVSAGQAAAGAVSGVNHKLGVGFWYGAASTACPIAMSGDVNLTSSITSADIIVLVNYVFKGGAAPLPCAANGDVNCGGTVTSSDIIVLVNYVFKGGAAPCNICTIIPSLWSCP